MSNTEQELRYKLQAMHRRAQKAEGKLQSIQYFAEWSSAIYLAPRQGFQTRQAHFTVFGKTVLKMLGINLSNGERKK